jgi:hypothetical protein
MKDLLRSIIAIVLAGLVADFIHTHVGIGVPTYNAFIQTISYLTKPEEALGIAIIYYLLGDHLPTHSRIIKALLLSAITLLSQGELIRQLLMNLLLPNTWQEALRFQSHVWLANLTMTLIIVFSIKPLQKNSHKK